MSYQECRYMLFEFITGKFMIMVAFVAALLSMVAFFKAARVDLKSDPKGRWFSLGRRGFLVMVAAIAFSGVHLLYLILTHQFEYNYVKHYSSTDLNVFYLISTFYAGQEGSFLLWAFFAAMFGFFVMGSSKKPEPHVMTVVMLSEAFMLSMLLGITLPSGATIGSDLFGLVPGAIEKSDLFSITLKRIPEGDGLNPLLQNPWMVIHPPVLFVGFAALLIPFAYAIAALWTKQYDNWIRPAMPWTVFSTAMLGLGIIMGGYWSYKVLGWGGYWGWDPVENSSLVPWLVAAALIHTMIVQKKNGGLKRTNLTLAILAYVAVLYSTFLTRSGILGDFSVHSFADLGLYRQLITFVLTFLFLGVGMLLWKFKEIPVKKSSDSVYSREFLLLGGSLILLLIGIVVAAGTSAPIINRLFTSRPDPVLPEFYNRVTLPLAVLMGILLAIAPFTSAKENTRESLIKTTLPALVIALAFSVALLVFGLRSVPLFMLALTAMFSLVSNIQTFIKVVRVQPRNAGGPLSHIGVALMLLGMMAGHYDRTDHLELIKNTPTQSFGKTLTYTGAERTEDSKDAFVIQISDGDEKSVAKPVMYQSREMTIQIPDVQHSLARDFYISPVNLMIDSPNQVQLSKNKPDSIGVYQIELVGFKFEVPDSTNRERLQIKSVLEVKFNGNTETVEPIFEVGSGNEPKVIPVPLSSNPEITFAVTNINADDKTILVESHGISELPTEPREVLLIEASIKPYINVLWFGTYLLTFGFMLSIYRRWKEQDVEKGGK
ncbi:MAG: cytochrome c biogenesis protein CcsA [Chlorobiales bacterium]|nr:cytochrome c biogenesis protein CcsA [Chlorobiales bacterium]